MSLISSYATFGGHGRFVPVTWKRVPHIWKGLGGPRPGTSLSGLEHARDVKANAELYCRRFWRNSLDLLSVPVKRVFKKSGGSLNCGREMLPFEQQAEKSPPSVRSSVQIRAPQ